MIMMTSFIFQGYHRQKKLFILQQLILNGNYARAPTRYHASMVGNVSWTWVSVMASERVMTAVMNGYVVIFDLVFMV